MNPSARPSTRDRIVLGAAWMGIVVALGVLLLWPALATALTAWRGGETESGGGLITPPSASGMTADLPRQARLAGETLRLVASTVALAFAAGLPLAWILFRTDARWRHVSLGVLALLAFVPLPVHAAAWLGALGNVGRARPLGLPPVLVGWHGAAVVHALAAVPWVVFLAGVGLRVVEPELEETALLDLSPWRVAWKVTFRRAWGALGAAALAVAVLTAGDMTVTDLLSVRTYAEEAYFQYGLGRGPAAAGATALPPLLALGLLLVVSTRVAVAADPARLASAAARARVWPLGSARAPVGLAALGVATTLLVVPLATLVWHAGRLGGTRASGRSPAWSLDGFLGSLRFAWADAREPLVQSLVLATIAATLALVLAACMAWMAREPGFGLGLAIGATALALAAPGPVVGMALVFAYRDWPAVYDSPARLVFAGVARTFPFALLVLWPAVRAVPGELLDVAAVSGLDLTATLARVVAPLTRGAALAAWAVAFVIALGELPASNIVCPPGWDPLPRLIWGLIHSGVESRLAGIVLIMLGTVLAAGLFATAMLSRLSVSGAAVGEVSPDRRSVSRQIG